MLRGRHAYTTETYQRAADSDDLWAYGRTFGAKVSGVATDCDQSAFDTHANAAEVVFENIVAHRCYALVGLRGRRNKVKGANGTALNRGIWVFTHTDTSDSWGHDIHDVTMTNVGNPETGDVGYFPSIQFQIHTGNSVQETRPTRLRNITIDGYQGRVMGIQNATVEFDEVKAVAPAILPTGATAVEITHSVVRGRNLRLDYYANTVGDTQSLVQFGSGQDGSLILSGHNEWFFDSTAAARMTGVVRRADNSEELVQISSLRLDALPVLRIRGDTVNAPYSADSYIDWATSGGIHASAVVGLADSNLADTNLLARLANSPANPLVLYAALSADITLGALPPGRFIGQTLVIVRTHPTSSAVLTIPNDTAKLIQTSNKFDFKLRNSMSTILVWNGTYWAGVVAAELPVQPSSQSGTIYTPIIGDTNRMVRFTNGSAVTVTIPTNASVPFLPGSVLEFAQTGTGQVTIAPADGTVTLNATPGLKISARYGVARATKLSTNDWLISGDLAA